jgi:amidase
VIDTARLLDSLGHHVQPATVAALDDPAMTDALPTLFSAVIARDLDRWNARVGPPIAPAELEPMNAKLAERGRAISAPQWLAAIEAWQSWARRVAAWWAEGFDLLLTPTLPAPPPLLGELAPTAAEPADLLARQTALMTFTLPFNVTGQPAISLPMHWNADGLPIGVQLVAAYGREDLLIRLAAQLEQALPWAHRHPPHGA